MKAFNPDGVVKPASNYVQCVTHALTGERMVISGQLGVTEDGNVCDGIEAQMEQAWRNIFAVMKGGGFEREHLIRATIYVTEPGQVGVYRAVRDRMLEGHLCANTYIEISALAAPDLLVEIEAEAIKE